MGLPPLAQSARTIFHFDKMNHPNMNFFFFLPTIGGKNHKDGIGLPPSRAKREKSFHFDPSTEGKKKTQERNGVTAPS